jgi:hypothetical protein
MSLKLEYEQRKEKRAPDKSKWVRQDQIIPLFALLISSVTAIVSFLGFLLNRSAVLATNRAMIAPVVGRWTTPPITGAPFGLTLTYQNIGKEPARRLTYYQEAIAVPMESGTTVFAIPADDICQKVKVTGNVASTVFPLSSNPLALRLPPQKDNPLVPTVESRESVLVWRGCFKYLTYNQVHSTTFCYWLRGEEGTPLASWQWNFCPNGNEAD